MDSWTLAVALAPLAPSDRGQPRCFSLSAVLALGLFLAPKRMDSLADEAVSPIIKHGFWLVRYTKEKVVVSGEVGGSTIWGTISILRKKTPI